MFFSSWSSLLKLLFIGTVAYVTLIVLLRLSGKRTLAQLNAFDYVITVAIGSTLASVMTSKTLPMVEGLAALGLLIALQFIVAWTGTRFRPIRRFIKSEPRLLYHKGEFLKEAMDIERINEEEILQAVRSQGVGSLKGVEAVILETNGNFSIISQSKNEEKLEEKSSLKNVE